MLLVLAAAKQVGLRGGYPGRWLVCSRASSIYWFKVSFLRGSPSAFDAWWHANNPLLGATTCPLVWRLMLLVLAAALARGWATTVVTACAKGIAWSVWRWWMVWCSSKWWHMQHPMEKSVPTTISLSGGDRSFGDDLFESRYCKCWEYPLWYDPLRFILCFSVCCPLLSAFLLINLCYWQFLASPQIFTQIFTHHTTQNIKYN